MEVGYQREWIDRCSQDPSQLYFIIMDRHGEALGTVRLYDPSDQTFSWGSWIVIPGRGPFVALESALMVYHVGLHLGLSRALLSVRANNDSVIRFHQWCGAVTVGMSDDQYLMALERGSIARLLNGPSRRVCPAVRIC